MAVDGDLAAVLKEADLPPHRVRHGTIYPDKWCSPYLAVEFPGLEGRIAIDLEIWNPEMDEFVENEVVIRSNHRLIRTETMEPGDLRRVTLEQEAIAIDGHAFSVSIRSAKHFVPQPPDTRMLALVVRRFSIRAL